MTTGKTIVLTRRTFVDKVMSLLFNMLSRLIITLLPESGRLSKDRGEVGSGSKYFLDVVKLFHVQLVLRQGLFLLYF